MQDSCKIWVLQGLARDYLLGVAGLLLNALLHIHPLTFINVALHLSGSPFVASTVSS